MDFELSSEQKDIRQAARELPWESLRILQGIAI